MAKSGRRPATQIFIMYGPEKFDGWFPGDYGGVQLIVQRHPFIEHSADLRHPYSKVNIGRFVQHTEGEHSRMNLYGGEEDGEDLPTRSIIRKLTYDDVTGDQCIVTGIDESLKISWFKVQVRANEFVV